MSVAKTGSDDHNCGLTNHDPIHQAICRLVASGVTVVAAAGNNHFSASRLIPASYNEVITVSALADSDGKPGGVGGQCLLLVGQLRPRRHVRQLLELRPRRGHHRAREVHLVDGARRLRLPLGDLDGRAARDRRRRPVQGVAAAGDACPGSRRAHRGRQPRLEAVERPGPVPRAPARRLAHRQPRRLRAGRGVTVGRARRRGRLAQDHGRGRAGRGRHGRHEPRRQRGLAAHRHVERSAALGAQRHHVRALDQRAGGDADGALPRDRDRQRRWPRADGSRRDRGGHGPPERGQGDARRRPRDALRHDPLHRPRQLAGRHRRDDRHRRLPGPLAGRRRQVGRDDRPRVDDDGDQSHVRRRPSVHAPGAHAGRGRQLEPVDADRAVHRGDRPGPQLEPRHYAYVAGRLGPPSGRAARLGTRASPGRRLGRAFTGRAVAVVAPMGPDAGRRASTSTACCVRTLHLHRKRLHPRRVVFTRTWATSANHTITVVVAGTKGHPRVDVDAFVIVR